MMPALRIRRVWPIAAITISFYGLVAYFTEAPTLTSIENMMELAIAGGICAAYIPGSIRFLFSEDTIEPGDWLGLGVVLTWTAGFLGTMFSIVWRAHGQPMSWINSDVTTFIKAMYIAGGTCHLLAPGALKRQIPTKRWIQLGIVIACAMFLSLVVAWAADLRIVNIQSVVSSYGPPYMLEGSPNDYVAGPAPEDYARPKKQRFTPMDNLLHRIADPSYDGELSARIEARVPQALHDRLDDWMAQNHVFNRSEAVRRLMDEALDVEDRAAAEPFEPERR